MASIEVANLFAVKSLVAVITGGGSGQSTLAYRYISVAVAD